MPERASEKCRLCSKLAIEQALAKHGPEGTGCWEGEPCHKRRSYYRYRDRYNRDRRLKYHLQKQTVSQLQGLTVPEIPAVVVYFYRQRKTAPLHALGLGLWVGQQQRAALPVIHTLGWTEGQIRAYLREAVKAWSQQYDLQISGVAATVELDPQLCPLLPCPLQVEVVQEVDTCP